MGSIITKREPPVVPKFDYPVRVAQVKVDQPNPFNNNEKEVMVVSAEIVEGQYRGTKARHNFNQILSSQSKLTSFLAALGLPEMMEGQSVDVAKLAEFMLNRQFIGTIETKQKDGKTFYNLTAWRPHLQPAPGTSIAPSGPIQPAPAGYPAPAPAPAPAAYPPGYVPPLAGTPVAQPAPSYVPPAAPPSATGRPGF